MSNSLFIESSPYRKLLNNGNASFANIDEMLRVFRWNRLRFMEDSKLVHYVTDLTMPSLIKHDRVIDSDVISSSVSGSNRTITIPAGTAISNIRIVGTGWSHAMMMVNDLVFEAFEEISDPLDVFMFSGGCLQLSNRDSIIINVPADIMYDIVCPIMKASKHLKLICSMKQIKLQLDGKLIRFKSPCYMIELRSDIPIHDPCLGMVHSKNSFDIIPFTNYLGIWKLEFDPPISSTDHMKLIYSRSEAHIKVRIYLHVLYALSISDRIYVVRCDN
jgi:hypothetical protein